MTALLETPTPAAPTTARASRPWATVLAALLVLAGAVGSFGLWASATVDLSAGSSRFGGTADVVTVPQYGARGTHVVDYRHGADVEFVVPIRNDGPLPVRVTVATAGAVVLPLLGLAGDALPVTVPPGQSRDLVLRGTLGNCAYYHERQVQNVESVTVEAEVLGLAVTRVLPLDSPLLVHSPMIVDCPDRTLTRNDDARSDRDPGSRL